MLAVTTRQLVHAALWLVVTLGALAGCYLVLGAELVALVQVLVYVGAVVVLVLFALMLTRAPIGRSAAHSTSVPQRVAGAVVAAGTAALLGGVLVPALGGQAVRVHEGRTEARRHGAVRLVGAAVRAAVAAAARRPGRRVRPVSDAGPRRAGRARMIHLALPIALVALLAGTGVYGVLARRNAVLVLIGVELMLNAANLLFVTVGSISDDPLRTGQVLALFVITIAAAEIGVALAVVLALFRSRGSIDLTEPGA